MAPAANPDDARMAEIASWLAREIEQVVPGWIEALVVERVRSWEGTVEPEVGQAAAAAGIRARDELMPRMRALLDTDVDEQRANPLELLRGATRHAGELLDRLGVPPVERDEFAERSFPDDGHDLMPATWSDVDPSLQEAGITWGAAKAHVHKSRRRAEGDI